MARSRLRKPAGQPACIANHTLEEYRDLVKSFHGYVAPGLLAGGFMVDLAMRCLPQDILFDAFCETYKCLPDAVQLLTPCTIGNGWLKVLDFGRFALCLYEKHTGQGVRVFLDPEKIKILPAIQTWFFKLQPKERQNHDQLFNEIEQAGESIYTIQDIQVLDRHLKQKKMGKRSICTICGEAYPESHGAICRGCRDQTPYLLENRENASFSAHIFKKSPFPLSADPNRMIRVSHKND